MSEARSPQAGGHGSAWLQGTHRRYLTFCVWILVPALGVFAFADALDGRWRESLSGVLLSTLLLATAAVSGKEGWMRWVMRVGAAVVLILTALETYEGLNEGVTFLWFYPFPIAIFFLLGAREGALWTIAAMAGAFALVLGLPGGHDYAADAALVFNVTFGMVCVLAFVLESSRSRLVGKLRAESAALRQALDQVSTLQELMPICAQCKSVRDDRGYWHQLESYLLEHTAAELEPALCPDCSQDGGAA